MFRALGVSAQGLTALWGDYIGYLVTIASTKKYLKLVVKFC
jgi:hypothetical protein